MEKWEEWLDGLRSEAATILKGEIKNLLDFAQNDLEEFIKEQGKKIEKYLNQLADGKITKEQFKSYITDIKALVEMKKLQFAVAAKASAQRLVEGIADLLMNSLLALI